MNENALGQVAKFGHGLKVVGNECFRVRKGLKQEVKRFFKILDALSSVR